MGTFTSTDYSPSDLHVVYQVRHVYPVEGLSSREVFSVRRHEAGLVFHVVDRALWGSVNFGLSGDEPLRLALALIKELRGEDVAAVVSDLLNVREEKPQEPVSERARRCERMFETELGDRLQCALDAGHGMPCDWEERTWTKWQKEK